MRYCMLHTIEVAGGLLLFIKLAILSETVMSIALFCLYLGKTILIHAVFIFQATFIRDQMNVCEKQKKRLADAQR